MRILEKKRDFIFYCFLVSIASTIILRSFNTILIICFVGFSLIFFARKNDFRKADIYSLLIIASPLLLDFLFFWNNDDLLLGIKSLEKRITLLIFPLIIIGFYKKIDLDRILKCFVLLITILLMFLLIRYIILFNNNFMKYLRGIHLWEMGYDFANSFNSHAPALNMHVSFAALSSLYLGLNRKKIFFLLYLLLFLFILYINTRIALVNFIIFSLFIFTFELFRKKKSFKLIIRNSVLLILILSVCLTLFCLTFPRLIKKFTTIGFSDMDKIGMVDDIERPETKHGSLVIRLSIWKSVLELAKEKKYIGYGASDSKAELVNYFKKTNQNHLAKWKFPVHNQYLDFLLKFGFLGFLVVLVYVMFMAYLGIKIKNPLIFSFFMIFFISNLTDDFLIRYDGIVFSGFWMSVFANNFKYNKLSGKEN